MTLLLIETRLESTNPQLQQSVCRGRTALTRLAEENPLLRCCQQSAAPSPSFKGSPHLPSLSPYQPWRKDTPLNRVEPSPSLTLATWLSRQRLYRATKIDYRRLALHLYARRDGNSRLSCLWCQAAGECIVLMDT